MNLIVKLILGVILMASILGAEGKHQISGMFDAYYAKLQTEVPGYGSVEANGVMGNLQINYDYRNDNFYFQATPYAYIYETKDGNKLKLDSFYKPHEKYEIFFRSFYASYRVYKGPVNITLGLGVLPFSNSSPTEFSRYYISDGEGINILNDSALTSVFALFEGSSKTIVGIGTPEALIVPSGNFIDETLRDGSYTVFLINTYKNEKYKLISELLYNDMKFERKDLATVELAGVSLSWDDSANSGWSFFSSLGVSCYNNHNLDAKDVILEEFNIPSYLPKVKPESFTFDEDKDYYGAAFLLGTRKDFEVMDEDLFVNAEWFHTWGVWSSGNQGTLYNGAKYTQAFFVRNNSIYFNIGWTINDNQQISIMHQWIEMKNSPSIGMPASRIPYDDYLGISHKDLFIHQINWSYRF